MILTKKYRIIHSENNESLLAYLEEFTGKTYVGQGMTGVEFDTLEAYEAYISDKNITFSETFEKPESQLYDEIPKLDFKLALLKFGVLEQDVIDTINLAFENNLISAIKKEELLLRWTQSAVIESNNPDLFALIPLLNQVKGSEVITQQDIENIFRK